MQEQEKTTTAVIDYGDGWLQQFPTEEGQYWFHGQRWKNAPTEELETHFCEVTKAGGDALIVVAGGSFMFKGELGQKWAFKKTEFPKIPNLEQ